MEMIQMLRTEQADESSEPAPTTATTRRMFHRRWAPASVRTRRALMLAAVVIVGALGYGLLLARLDLWAEPREHQFGVSASDAQIGLYLQPIVLDPLNDSMQMRVSVIPAPSSDGTAPLNVADRDLVLLIHRGSQTEQVQIRSGQPLPETNLELDLNDGSVRSYPLDRYRSEIRIACFFVVQGAMRVALPIHIVSWEGIFGYDVHGEEISPSSPGELWIRFAVHRTGAVRLFGLAAYGAMLILTLCAVTIGTLVFVGIRRIEVTLIGAVGAIIFALPALRNTLPGSPPLGVWADVLVYFWAELGAVVALGLYVIAWARRGAQPDPEP
jgi:hypothetical protein